MSGEGSLIIRVKRRRTARPLSSLCIVEEDSSGMPPSKHSRASSSSLADTLAALSTNAYSGEAETKPMAAAVTAVPHLILGRIGTIAVSRADRAAVEAETIDAATSHKRGRASGATAVPSNEDDSLTAPSSVRGDESYVLVTRGRKAIRTTNKADGGSGYSSYVVVDMTLVENKQPSSATAGAPTNSSAAPAANGLVLDPMTRRLDAAITTAISSDDFAPILEALKIGADPRYAQPASRGGRTALMASALRANGRMIGTLLARGASALATDASGRTALELLRQQQFSGDRRTAAMQAAILLQNATVKEMQLRRLGSGGEQHADESMDAAAAEEEEDFVTDVYMLPLAAPPSSAPEPLFHGPVVQIEGLRILEDGLVDLVYAYDSDWSDLADDEDPDSNDERYFGNDYPEEEEEEGEAWESGSECGDSRPPQRRTGSEEYGSERSDDDEHESLRVGGAERRSVGRVVRHVVGHDPFGDADTGDRERLRRLWGEDEDDHEEESDGFGGLGGGALREHRDRISAMRDRSGLGFAARPHEFYQSGLPKFGAELSDDEEDAAVLRRAYAQSLSSIRPSKDLFGPVASDLRAARAVAFDPELDLESD